jgi:hypothetical protein
MEPGSSVSIVTSYSVSDQLRLIDYNAAEPRNTCTCKSESYVRGSEGFDNGNFIS